MACVHGAQIGAASLCRLETGGRERPDEPYELCNVDDQVDGWMGCSTCTSYEIAHSHDD